MKLVEIKDARVGQIWKKEDEYRIFVLFDDDDKSIAGNSFYAEYEGNINLVSDFEDRYDIGDIISTHSLVGFLGITHEIKDNKLVEIPRDEFEVDDIVNALKIRCNKKDNTVIVKKTGYEINTFSGKSLEGYYTDDPDSKFFPKKIGVLGVTHEFVNERLAK